MKQQNIKFLLALLISMLGVKASAHDIEVKNADGVTIYYNFINNNTELAVSFRGTSCSQYSNEYSGNVVIPENVTYNGNNYSVTSIGIDAFYGCSGLTSITIPNSVTSIGEGAFRYCSGLTEVNFNATNCTTMGSSGYPVFYGCSSLSTVNIGDNVQNIPSYAFYGCSGLTNITIPNSVTSIGGGAFGGTAWYNNQPGGLVYAGKVVYRYKGIMPSNTNIVLEDGTLGITDYAFSDCSGLTSITIPNSVTSIGNYAFSGCSGLTSITIPNSVTSIGDYAFLGCSGLTSITIPNSVTSIEEFAFSGCSGLMSVTIPNSVTSIGGSAFYGCSSLTSINIPNSVTSIGGSAFSGCSGLTSIDIPNSVTSIGSDAFSGCDNIMTVHSEITEPFNCKDVFSDNTLRKGTLYIPAGTKDLYTRFDGWREFLKIEEGTSEPEQYVWLSVRNGRGMTKLKVKKGTEQELAVTVEDGWKILTATIDGTDITSQIQNGNIYTTPSLMNDATITIVYERDVPMEVYAARQSSASVKVVDDGIIISDAEPQTTCVVYSSSGQQVVNTVIEDSSKKIPLQKGQVYILMINGRTLKFAL